MDRCLILAVAGSGKTTLLINQFNLEQNFLVVTYTDNNVEHIRQKIIGVFGYEPQNITLLSYYQFLIRLCYNPFFKDKISARGIQWDQPGDNVRYVSSDNIAYYVSPLGLLYHNRISKLCQHRADLIRERIERYFDCFMFDEVQDLAGNDFNFVASILPRTIDCLLVGDFFQHTYNTSNDGNVNTSLHENYDKYQEKWECAGLEIDTTTLSKSYRCSPRVCSFVESYLGIAIESHRIDDTEIKAVEVADAEDIFNDDNIVKLFYQGSNKYRCNGINWGASKGLDDFEDICIVLNDSTLKAFKKGTLSSLPSLTRNKLYVACTRARHNIYFVSHKYFDKYKIKDL